MKNTRAFTLIEVMVVLSILALIAILAYNFFGGVMKEATLKQQVTKVYNDLRILSDATAKYEMDNGSVGAIDTSIGTLVTAGIIKSLPTTPVAILTSGNESEVYDFREDYDCLGPASIQFENNAGCVQDDAFRLRYVTDEFCKAYNEAYSTFYPTPEIWDYAKSNGEATGFPDGGSTYCLLDGSNRILFIQALRE